LLPRKVYMLLRGCPCKRITADQPAMPETA
jgi:hypothetical protein